MQAPAKYNGESKSVVHNRCRERHSQSACKSRKAHRDVFISDKQMKIETEQDIAGPHENIKKHHQNGLEAPHINPAIQESA